MKLLKNIYYNACSVLPVSVVKKLSPVRTLFPYHHTVSDDDLLHIKHLYKYKNVQQFKLDLDFLLKHFKPVTAAQLVAAFHNEKALPDQSFLLTFDDGFREIYDVVAPILYQKGIPAVFFINPAFIGNKELFYRCKISLVIDELLKVKEAEAVNIALQVFRKPIASFDLLITELKNLNQHQQGLLDQFATHLDYSFEDYLKKQQPFLTAAQVKELDEKGFTIGAHSWDHPYYEYLNAEEQIQQTVNSSTYVSIFLSNDLSFFSFPHSDEKLSQSFFDTLHASDTKIDLLFGIQNQKREDQNKMVHRFNCERPEINIQSQVNGILLYSMFQKALGRNKIQRL